VVRVSIYSGLEHLSRVRDRVEAVRDGAKHVGKEGIRLEEAILKHTSDGEGEVRTSRCSGATCTD
jgi:hypothetical protein